MFQKKILQDSAFIRSTDTYFETRWKKNLSLWNFLEKSLSLSRTRITSSTPTVVYDVADCRKCKRKRKRNQKKKKRKWLPEWVVLAEQIIHLYHLLDWGHTLRNEAFPALLPWKPNAHVLPPVISSHISASEFLYSLFPYRTLSCKQKCSHIVRVEWVLTIESHATKGGNPPLGMAILKSF